MKRIIFILFVLIISCDSYSQRFKFYTNFNKNYTYINYRPIRDQNNAPNISSIAVNRKNRNFSINIYYGFNDKLGIFTGFSNVTKEYTISYNMSYIIPNSSIYNMYDTITSRNMKMVYFDIPLLLRYKVFNSKSFNVYHSIGFTTNIYNFNFENYFIYYDKKEYMYKKNYIDYINQYVHKVYSNISLLVDADLLIFKWGGINIGGEVDFGINDCLKEPVSSKLITLKLRAGIFFQ